MALLMRWRIILLVSSKVETFNRHSTAACTGLARDVNAADYATAARSDEREIPRAASHVELRARRVQWVAAP